MTVFLIPYSLLASSSRPHLQKRGKERAFFIKGPGGRVSNISPQEGSFKVYLCFVILAGLQKKKKGFNPLNAAVPG